ncbi:SPOR domain-containing protein [Roseovarius sp. LXJ103]|uniref:SPOR domain-containing protein n=1 Tax=Roseovarius carneus TaxID=2853164 RepID=UPI000D60FC68|nr:SPOR domain-containing protein [Roseovarius carneus]MBZ8119740.1 SPOR domain-containing protein [Roseovarius carneus]PWE34654.1 SPOR domain-containing protein [Pelagicola sp. LXJ1103]
MTTLQLGYRQGRVALLCSAAVMALAGCQGLEGAFQTRPEAQANAADTLSTRLVERDVEAPDVFQKTDMGLWDGRPSLGGVWVAHPDVIEPERVIIRNTANSKFVIGALFKRERSAPGPAFQMSSDAAAALGMLAGAPGQLNVTALRREAAPAPTPEGELAPEAEALTPAEIEATTLDPVAGAAAAAIESAEIDDSTATADPTPATAPAAAPAPRAASSLTRPFIQIGIFSVEQNANNTATAMRQAGMVPTVIKQSSQGKTFWRVVVGPATSTSERAALLKKIKGVGFDDAYAVTN